MSNLCNIIDGEKQSDIKRIYLDVKYLRGKSDGEYVMSGKYVPTNSTMILVDGENSGEIFTTTIDGYQGSTFKLLDISNEMFQPFVLYIIKSYQKQFREHKVGSAIPHLNKKLFREIVVGVPPYDEQKRIVEEIEKCLSFIDEVKSNKHNLQDIVKQAKSKVLDLAIHGKLVEQNPNDEPAIELLKRMNPNYTPCDNSHYGNLPSGWCVCSIKDVFDIIMGSSPSGSTLNKEKDGVEFHQGKMCFTDKYLKKSDVYTYMPTKLAEANSILLCVRAPVGIVNITEREICIGRGLCSLKPKAGIDFMFAYYALQTHKEHFVEQASGSTFNAIGGDTIRNEFFILPPYKEQIRIHEKIENILQQLNTINVEL